MPKPEYLIDVNLPYYFSLWEGEKFVHQADLGDTWTDEILEICKKTQPDCDNQGFRLL